MSREGKGRERGGLAAVKGKLSKLCLQAFHVGYIPPRTPPLVPNSLHRFMYRCPVHTLSSFFPQLREVLIVLLINVAVIITDINITAPSMCIGWCMRAMLSPLPASARKTASFHGFSPSHSNTWPEPHFPQLSKTL